MYNIVMVAVNYLELLPEITGRIVAISQPKKVILFGSYARGDQQQDSDLDLLVIMDKVDSPRAESNRIRRALRGLLVPMDVIVASCEQIEVHRNTIGFIYKSALDEGKVIYERIE